MDLSKLQEIRKITIIAMFSDDDLMKILVLKGGNAISLFLKDYSRASIDLDFSLCDDIDNENQPLIEEKIRTVLEKTFKEHGYVVFDYKFYPKPKIRKEGLEDFWGGYRIEFKVIQVSRYKELGGDINKIRQASIPLGEGEKKPFTIDISKHEFCGFKKDFELDGYTIYVYTPEMMVIEKIRAICQQMPEYPYGNKGARARDFYDIHLLMESCNIDLTSKENLELTEVIFRAKDVPLNLIGKIPKYKAYHESDFISVSSSTQSGMEVRDYDYYFDYVVDKTKGLEVLWKK
jgi:predicted nucleotidyltransferase component of viral defense system